MKNKLPRELCFDLMELGYGGEISYFYYPKGIGDNIKFSYCILHESYNLEPSATIEKLYKKGILRKTIPCLLYEDVIDWIDDEYGLLGTLMKYNDDTYDYIIYHPGITEEKDHGDGPFESKWECKMALIKTLIEIIKDLK